MQHNYFHAVFEASKGLAQRIRDKASVDGDGAKLVDSVFSVNGPVLAFNTLQTEIEKSEHKGFTALLKGCFAGVRNPLAHEPKIMWHGEDDAADSVGYLIAWRNPSVRLKDGSSSSGKRILIDGQQRVTALMAALLGHEVLTKDYETVPIRIAFHPVDEKFEVSNPAIQKDVAWIPDLTEVFAPDASLKKLTRDCVSRNPDGDQDEVLIVLERVRKIINNHVGFIELAEDLHIETVTEIFIRVNSAGASLSQADFAMSKIAANDTYGGDMLRRAIDLLLNRSDVRHVYPRNHLKKQGLTRGRYNQIANLVLSQSEINIGIGDKAPEAYFEDLAEQCNGGPKKYGGITEPEKMRANLRMSCLPEYVLNGDIPEFDDFLEQRRKLMAHKIKTYFEAL